MAKDTDLRADIAAAKNKMSVKLGAGLEIKRLTADIPPVIELAPSLVTTARNCGVMRPARTRVCAGRGSGTSVGTN
jgi:hypothetical protein